ncbi:RimK family alpha-L-glutamate ligase [Dactylosporangium sp. NPDC048998]|uniref:ATP-grasp domain-containing protein n=1 Tax=Dactylosporangium sp. NPDC048998 TaxID=3363976 RepID=UPI003718700E
MLRRMCWLFPDRESSRTSATWNAAFWQTYAEVAKELDLSWERVTPESVAVDALDPARPRVRIDGAPVSPEDTLFITSLYSLPYQAADVFNQLALYAVLEQAGFYLPHPTSLATLCNDKLASVLFLRDCPVPPIPTVRIGSGRDLVYDDYEASIAALPYPALAKPSGWCASRGINLARDPHDVCGLLSLAQGGDTALVFQPYLGRSTVDYRVYLVDGEPLGVLVRRPGDGALYTQFSTGGSLAYTDLPDELRPAIAYFRDKLPVPYLCADFLHDGTRFWLSEIELDGTIQCPDARSPEAVRTQRELIAARFDAYRRGHARRFAGTP